MKLTQNLIFIFLLFSGLILSSMDAIAVDEKSNTAKDAQQLLKELPHLKSKISIDGQLTESAWQSALIIDLNFEVEPVENGVAPVVTQARLFEDGENLYIAFIAEDNQPEAIRAYLSERDFVDNSDQVYVKLDTFNDSRKAFQFIVNPLGIQADRIIDEKNDYDDASWDAIWYSAGVRTSQGYQVEIQIPFQALRFSDDEQQKNWGIELGRLWPRDVVHRITNSQIDRDISCRICQFEKVSGFAKAEVSDSVNLTLIPAITTIQNDSRSPGTNGQWTNGNTESRLSLDLRWGISQDTYANATINPDFSQVEADAIQLNVNRLSTLFLDEKRAFFQDGADFFNNWSRLVYTRIFEEPKAGLKITSTSDAHSYGLMAVEDKHTNLLFPYEYGTELLRLENVESDNYIFRYRYDLGEQGNVGTTMTSRQSEGFQSSMLGVDGKYWLNKNDAFKYQILSSDTDYPEIVRQYRPEQKASIQGDALSLNYQHKSRNWLWSATYHRFDEDFRADTGFINFGNWQRGAFQLARTWYTEDPASWWKQFKLEGLRIESKEIDGTPIDRRSEFYLTVDAIFETEFVIGIIDGVQNYIEDGQPQAVQTLFDADARFVWTEFSPLPELDVELEYYWGDDIDYSTNQPAQVTSLTGIFNLQLSEQLNGELEYINETLSVYDDRVYRIDLINLVLAYQWSEKSSLRLSLQGSNLQGQVGETDDELLASQLVYSYKVNPFTLFYFGYSDQYRTEINSLSLQKTDKTLFIKFSYAWQK